MNQLVLSSILALIGLWVAVKAWGWRRLYVAAKATQFPVLLSPIHIADVWWVALLIKLLDPIMCGFSIWRAPKHPVARFWNVWKAGHKPFEEVGSDTFVLCTPKGNIVFTCEPWVITKLETSPAESKVAVETLKMYELYGPAIGSVEGADWKTHRKIIMAGFTPAINAMVWKEGREQTAALIERWLEQDGVVPKVASWTTRLALHVLSAVCFGKQLTWNEDRNAAEPLPSGHRMRYEEALPALLSRLMIMDATPRALLPWLPIPAVQQTYRAFTEWTAYMEEMRANAMANVGQLGGKRNKTILESIILAGTAERKETGSSPLPPESVMGNIFFFFIAGHETTGNTMAFMLNLLAMYPEYQAKIQQDLDALLAHRPHAEWTVDREYQALQNGWYGAVLKEVLRLYSVVPFLPRQIVAPLALDETHVVPASTLCLMDFPAALRNPHRWQTNASVSAERRAELHHSPALDFNPEQWMRPPHKDGEGEVVTPFFPFGQGHRICPGRLFSQIEMTAMLSTLLVEHNVELISSDEVLEECKGDACAARHIVREQAFRTMVDGVTSFVAVRLLDDLPVRLVRRERSKQ